MSYNSARYGVTFGGVPARAFVQGSDVSWDLDSDEAVAYSDARGGNGIIVYTNDTKGKCTVTLQATDPCIPLWVAAFIAAKKTGASIPLMMYDRNAETAAVAFASKATLSKTPPFARGTGEPRVEVTFIFPACTPPLSA